MADLNKILRADVRYSMDGSVVSIAPTEIGTAVATGVIAGPKGDPGEKGEVGADGKEVELQNTGTYIQWRYTGGTWQDLVSLSSITGADGADGTDGKEVELDNDGTNIRWRYVGESWNNLIPLSSLKGDKGDKGNTGNTGPQGPAGINTWGSITGTLSSQTDLQNELDTKVEGVGTNKITVSATEPSDPSVGDIWVVI